MNTYVIFLRGINVGGKNIISMTALKNLLEDLGYRDVSTYIASGNVILMSDKTAHEIKLQVEAALTNNFKLDSELIKVLVLSQQQLQAVIERKPEGFGEGPEKYHSDAIFLMDIDADQAMAAFSPKEGIDMVWPGKGVVYSQRLSAMRTKSRLSKIVSSPLYKSMTIRNWNTTTKLLNMMKSKNTGEAA